MNSDDNFFNIDDESETISQPPPKIRRVWVGLIGKLLNNPYHKFDKHKGVDDAIRDMKKALKGKLYVKDYTIKPHMRDGFLEFSFKNPSDKQRVMDERPWVLGNEGYLLVLEEWFSLGSHTPMPPNKFTTCPFWIQAHGIPAELMSQAIGSDIREAFGAEALQVDLDENESERSGFFRIKVMVDVNKRVISGCWLVLPNSEEDDADGDDKLLWVSFIYEKLPFMCFSCGIIGHTIGCWSGCMNEINSANENSKLDHGNVMVEYYGGENEKPVVSEGQILIDMRKVGYGSWMQDQSQPKESRSYHDFDSGPDSEGRRRKREGKIVLPKEKINCCAYEVNEENVISVVLQPKP